MVVMLGLTLLVTGLKIIYDGGFWLHPAIYYVSVGLIVLSLAGLVWNKSVYGTSVYPNAEQVHGADGGNASS